MLKEAIDALQITGRLVVLRDNSIVTLSSGSLKECLKENNIQKEDVKTVYSVSEDTSILSVKDVIDHDVDVPLLRIEESGKYSWSSPKHIRTIRRAVAVV